MSDNATGGNCRWRYRPPESHLWNADFGGVRGSTSTSRPLILPYSPALWGGRQGGDSLRQFCEQVLLPSISSRIVVFIDEIDAMLAAGVSDEFFAALSSLYDARKANPQLNRLSFVALGVATPTELAQHPNQSLFDVGAAIELTDFTPDEASVLRVGFEMPDEHARLVLNWILDWTGGHPYLTLRACRTVAERKGVEWSESTVSEVIRELFLRGDERDSNIAYVSDRLSRGPLLSDVLSLYRRIRSGHRVSGDCAAGRQAGPFGPRPCSYWCTHDSKSHLSRVLQ
jgi:AAA-like domain